MGLAKDVALAQALGGGSGGGGGSSSTKQFTMISYTVPYTFLSADIQTGGDNE